MAVKTFRHRSFSATESKKRVYAGTITTNTNGHVYTATLTNDNGETAVISYTVAGSPADVTAVAVAFASAWNASIDPLVSQITAASAGAGVVAFTADTAGVPFSIALSATTGAWSSDGETQANVGTNDYGTAQAWSGGAVPTTDDDVVIPPGTVPIAYGLNQSAVAIDDFQVQLGSQGNLGRYENGKVHYLRLKPNSFRYRGQGQLAALDFGAEQISGSIESYGNPASPLQHSVYLKGSDLNIVTLLRGNIGIAVQEAETSDIAELIVSWIASVNSDVDVTLGSGLTLAALEQIGGIVRAYNAITTANVRAGAKLFTHGSGAIGTLNVWGEADLRSVGTITTLDCWGKVDLSKVPDAMTISTLIERPGGQLIKNANVTISARTALAAKGEFKLTQV